MVFIQPLDLQTILVNGLAGSLLIFLFIALIVIGFLGARFRMSNTIILIMIALFGVIVGQYLENGLYALIIIFSGVLIFYGIGSIVRRL